MDSSERDELLIRVDERTQRIDGVIKTHLKHHWTIAASVLIAILTGLISLVVSTFV